MFIQKLCTYLLIRECFRAVDHCNMAIIVCWIVNIFLYNFLYCSLILLILDSVDASDEKSVSIILNVLNFGFSIDGLIFSCNLRAWVFVGIDWVIQVLTPSFIILQALEIINIDFEFLVISNVVHFQIYFEQ